MAKAYLYSRKSAFGAFEQASKHSSLPLHKSTNSPLYTEMSTHGKDCEDFRKTAALCSKKYEQPSL